MNIKYFKLMLGMVMLFSLIFFPLRMQAQTPGGVNMTTNGYKLDIWVDGDHSTNSKWNNIATADYTLTKNSSNAPVVQNSKFNFHQELYFGNSASSKLFTSSNYNLAQGQSYYVFVVSDASAQGNSDGVLVTFNSSATNTSLRWNSASTNVLSSYWTTTQRSPNFSDSNHPRYGISTMNIANSNSSAFELYLNAEKSAFTLGTGNNSTGSALYNVPLLIGNASNSTTTGTTNQFKGTIQEIILIRKSSESALMPAAELAKIHSYLAIKYGIMLTGSNYVNSNGTIVWDRSKTGYTDYNNNIFGIGRDDASGLKQLQSRSVESNTLTIYKGSLSTLNKDNNNTELTDKTFLMLGSNRQTGITYYDYPLNSALGNTEYKVNYRNNEIYRAQLTNNGVAGGSQTVNVKVTYNDARYIIVSSNPSFPAGGSTRVYPISGNVATNVLINDGEYVSFAGYQNQPGGTRNTNIVAWLTPDSYNSGTWKNMMVHNPSSVGDFSGATIAPAKANTGGYNFYPVVQFDKTSVTAAPNQLYSALPHGITGTDNITSILVFQRKKIKDNWNFILGYSGAEQYSSLSWNTAASDNLTANAPNAGNPGVVGAFIEGILTVDNSNVTANAASEGLRVYKNGVKSAFGSTAWNGTTNGGNGTITLAGCRNNAVSYGYQGNLQEVILIKKSGNGHIDPTELAKIHSYLGIKYGITLTGNNYVNSDGSVIWNKDKTGYTDYNNNIFGIGRDDASGLNQVQSRSASSNTTLTIYKGTLSTLNKDNNNTELADKTFLILGSNSKTGTTGFDYPINSALGNTEYKVNYRNNEIYRAQLTNNGVAGGSQTVNVKVTYDDARYIIVSKDPSFPVGATAIYPISASVATGVNISDGDYVSIAGYQVLPGGADKTNIIAWLTPDSYSSGTWKNMMVHNIGSVGDFSGATVAPSIANTGGYNFYPVVQFNKTSAAAAPNQLFSALPHGISGTDNMTSIFVFQRKKIKYDWNFILGYSGADNYNAIKWHNSTLDDITVNAPSAATNAGPMIEGILTVDNSNVAATAASEGLRVYKNGVKTAYASAAWNGTASIGNGTVTLAGSRNTAAANGYQGNLQEVILIKKSGNGHIDAVELAKIHSYLAIKYGIVLTGNSYVNSDGATVWDATADATYSNNVFGIARDDKTNLYQRQSRSVNTDLITVYLGNTLTTLNNQSSGIIANDKTYLMFGSENKAPVNLLGGITSTQAYENGSLSMSDNPNIQSPVYKTRMVGATSMTVNMKTSMLDYEYVLVSNDPSFPTGVSGTKIYKINNYIAKNIEINQDYKYIKLIGFAPGPGGIGAGLSLWLRADDPATLVVEDRPASDATSDTNSNLYLYPLPANYDGAVSTVTKWSDFVRGQEYSYAAGAQVSAHRVPVMIRNASEMNYYPAVQYWAGTNYGSYLSNASTTVMPWETPPDGKHTAYFMVNNDFGTTNNWVYMLNYGGTQVNGTEPVGAYGVQKAGTGDNAYVTGRFRAFGQDTGGAINLFYPGATSMLGFQTRTRNTGKNNYMYFRFNGKEDNSQATNPIGSTFDWANVHFNTPSVLGPTYAYNRTMIGLMSEVILYSTQLTAEETNKLESYLAFKYGVTLSPSNTSTKRFNYTMSDGTIVWQGDTPSGKFVDFYNNISAVIRDDAARLNNRHSHSTNVGSLLHIGVAGTKLSNDGSDVGNLENNLEAVVSGSNNATGNTHISSSDTNPCGDFTDRFNRKWLIHKVTKDDRPVTLLIGAQNNASLGIGNDDVVKADYYSKLSAGYDISLIVGESPEQIENGIYNAVIPMSYINGEFQCSYTFTEEDTYITFGWKLTSKGCQSDENATFAGAKQFDWTQWTSRTNRAASSKIGLSFPATGEVDLGNDIKVSSTNITYPSDVKTITGFPRSVNVPSKGSLEILRRGGTVGQDVVVNVQFNHPVVPEFVISGLDSYLTSYEEVEIYGSCSGNNFSPVLSYASDPAKATYKIVGGTATVIKKGAVGATNKNGMLNVAFSGGVTSVTIKYRIKTKATTAAQIIYISPMTLRSVPPPPPVNEDGMSLVKQVKEREVTTCDPVKYSFYIQNTSCNPKLTNFSDILPAKMKWEVGSFGLDAASSEYNPSFSPTINPAVSGSGEELSINGLTIPGSSTLILTATAVFDEDAPSGQYNNRANITYDKIVNSSTVQASLYSVDRETLEPNTYLDAVHEQRQEQVLLDAEYSSKTYNANGEVEVTYTLTNTNSDITDMYLNVFFNEEFTLVGDVQITQKQGTVSIPAPIRITPDPDLSMFTIAGDIDGYDGFVLPTGVIEIKFMLKAPPLLGLVDELNDQGQPTGRKVDLNISYEFTSSIDDACVQTAVNGLQGVKLIPYTKGKSHIITNKNETTRMKK